MNNRDEDSKKVLTSSPIKSTGTLCFHGNCTVKMADDSLKLLCKIQTGDKILTPFGTTSVKYITKQECLNRQCEMVLIPYNGLLVTPTHPIKYNNKWVHPKTLYDTQIIYTPFIYNLVLEDHHSCYINDIECITIGHGQTADILTSYFGTCEAVSDIKLLGVSQDGFVHIPLHSIWRNEKGHVCKISVNL